jgi:hypothetical protein
MQETLVLEVLQEIPDLLDMEDLQELEEIKEILVVLDLGVLVEIMDSRVLEELGEMQVMVDFPKALAVVVVLEEIPGETQVVFPIHQYQSHQAEGDLVALVGWGVSYPVAVDLGELDRFVVAVVVVEAAVECMVMQEVQEIREVPAILDILEIPDLVQIQELLEVRGLMEMVQEQEVLGWQELMELMETQEHQEIHLQAMLVLKQIPIIWHQLLLADNLIQSQLVLEDL